MQNFTMPCKDIREVLRPPRSKGVIRFRIFEFVVRQREKKLVKNVNDYGSAKNDSSGRNGNNVPKHKQQIDHPARRMIPQVGTETPRSKMCAG